VLLIGQGEEQQQETVNYHVFFK